MFFVFFIARVSQSPVSVILILDGTQLLQLFEKTQLYSYSFKFIQDPGAVLVFLHINK